MLKDHPVADAAAVTAQWVTGVKRRPLGAQQRTELDPDRLQQA
jgi:hypothetical protein